MSVSGYTFVRNNTGRYTLAMSGTPMNIRRFDDSAGTAQPALVETIAISPGRSPSLTIRPDQSLELLYVTSSNEVHYRRSTNRGKTWTAAVTALTGYGSLSSDWDRKRSQLVAVVQDLTTLDWYLSTAKLDSGGALGAWSTPTLITAASEDRAACVRVGPDGRYGFAWGESGAVYYMESEDGGATWGTPYTVIASGWRNPSFDWCPKQRMIVMALQAATPIAIGPFNSYNWFAAMAPLDADGKPTVWNPGSYGNFLNPSTGLIDDPAFINTGSFAESGNIGGCLRGHPDGRMTFSNLPLTGSTTGIVDLRRATTMISVTGKWVRH